MKIARCDRCNKEIEEKRGWEKAVEFLTNAATQISAALRGEAGDFEYQLYRGEEPADLCPDCQKSLQEWLKAGSESQHQNEQEEQEPDRNIENEEIIVARIPKGPEPLKFGDF